MTSEDAARTAETGQRGGRRRVADSGRPPGYLLLWAVALVSLIINVVILRQVLIARQIALQSVRDSIAVLDGLQSQVIDYNFVVDQDLPIRTDIPVQETVPITIDDDFPLETSVTVTVPVGPFGRFPVTVPISTTVPVHRTIDISIDQTFSLDTTIPVHLEVPVVLNIADTPLFSTIEDTKSRLQVLERSLSAPLVPLPFQSPPTMPPSTEAPRATPEPDSTP